MRAASFLMLLMSGVAAADELPFYIGTYTAQGGSKGIYRATLDTETGTLAAPKLAAGAPGPSFLAFHPSRDFLYAVHEPTGGDVSAYAVEADGSLRLLNTESSQGGGPCHVSVDPAGRNVLTASYGAGTLACLPIKEDGSLSPASTVFKNSGSGPDKSRQEGPHLHAIYADPANRFVYACDLGTDEVLVFRFDAEAGKLTPAEPKAAMCPPGGGPRHLALHPNGRFAFVNNEMLNSVTAFARDPETGTLTSLQTISTLPDDVPRAGKSTAEIFCHPAGKWLYVSNRGHDSIAAYSIAEDGKLALVEIEPAGVAVPRGFGIDPTGRWLVVGGQKSNDLTALAIDPSTGELSPGPNKIAVGMPVCVVFPPAGEENPAAADAEPLEFRLAESEPADGLTESSTEDGSKIYLHAEPVLTSRDIAKVEETRDFQGGPAIHVTFTEDGGKRIRKVTGENLQKRLAILVGGKVVSAPVINERISDQAQITGRFTEEEATRIAESIRGDSE